MKGRSENKEDDLREEEKRTERPGANGSEVMGKVFRRPMTMRAYKYVNEVYYIPTRARVSVRTIRRSLCRQAKSGSVRTCASHLHELVIIPTSEIIKERLLCAAVRRS